MQNIASKQLIISGNTVIVPRDLHKGNTVEIPMSNGRRIYPTSDSRAEDENFTVDGVIAVISGSMDHTLSVFFKGHDVILVKHADYSSAVPGKRIQFSNAEGKLLLSIHLLPLTMYSSATNNSTYQWQRVIPKYSGRLMYDFEKDILKGAASFGLLAAIAVPFENKDEGYNGHDVPDFIKQFILERHI